MRTGSSSASADRRRIAGGAGRDPGSVPYGRSGPAVEREVWPAVHEVGLSAHSATGRVGARPFTSHLLGGAGAVVVLCLLGVVVNLADTGMYPQLGLPVAPLSIQVLVAALRVFVTLASAVALGSLVFAAFLTPAQPSGTVDVDGYRALRRGGWSAAAAGAGGLLLTVASAADLSGASPADVLVGGDPLGTFALLEEPMGWFLLGIGFCLVAVGCVWALSRRSTGLLAGLAAVSVLPPATVGQAAVGRGHDWATDAGVFQALALALWLGVLVALIAHHTRHDAHGGAEWRRGRVVLACAGVAWAGSTLVLGLLLVLPAGLTDSVWGRWQLVEAALFAGAPRCGCAAAAAAGCLCRWPRCRGSSSWSAARWPTRCHRGSWCVATPRARSSSVTTCRSRSPRCVPSWTGGSTSCSRSSRSLRSAPTCTACGSCGRAGTSGAGAARPRGCAAGSSSSSPRRRASAGTHRACSAST
ncbi:hypothetical protein BJF90_08890 [Pseudonocardia sp. CNS-004]|nr:hypothetical protein BJF90_08890 [Pseudonocardia sp. CNS-004]